MTDRASTADGTQADRIARKYGSWRVVVPVVAAAGIAAGVLVAFVLSGSREPVGGPPESPAVRRPT